jgi:hypothetical protein
LQFYLQESYFDHPHASWCISVAYGETIKEQESDVCVRGSGGIG